MFKKIDKFVFYISISGWLIMLLAFILMINTGDIKIFEYAQYISYILGFIIFIKFILDENYKFLYYVGFIISDSLMSKIFEVLTVPFITGLVSTILMFIIIGLPASLLSAYLYEFFKQKSYIKHKKI